MSMLAMRHAGESIPSGSNDPRRGRVRCDATVTIAGEASSKMRLLTCHARVVLVRVQAMRAPLRVIFEALQEDGSGETRFFSVLAMDR